MVRSETAYTAANWGNGVQNPFALHASMSGKRANCPADDVRALRPVVPVLRRNNARNSYQFFAAAVAGQFRIAAGVVP
eukprot:2109259-Rhodomonas_salina.1